MGDSLGSAHKQLNILYARISDWIGPACRSGVGDQRGDRMKKARPLSGKSAIGKEIIYFDSIASTNDKAFEIGRQRENPEGIVVVANMQTHGKGRLGRKWVSPPGLNLYFTVLLKPLLTPGESLMLILAAAVAVTTAIRKHTGLEAWIKWPNDILINGKKACGILTETKSGRDGINLIAIGIGINVNMPLDALADDIKPLATSLKIESGSTIEKDKMLGQVLAEFEDAYKNLLTGDKRALINGWLRLNCTIGSKVVVKGHDKTLSGIAVGINDKGELLVRLSSGEVKSVCAGDVTILKN